ncbi:MAG: hypothetical protein GX945_01085 [Lentisphaerae bacterium]|nr:hypothetical protein [Lentisphaerota bacterium]
MQQLYKISAFSVFSVDKKSYRFAFTLLELLIVIGMLGALATLILPHLAVARTEAFDPMVQTEMQDIRIAFQRFYNDVMPNEAQLDLFRKYGLAPLMQSELPGIYSFAGWDPDRCRGWRGPYLESEGTRIIDANSDGQMQAESGISIPVILDPYAKADGDARYYRVLCGKKDSLTYDPDKLALVFIGVENDVLDTSVHNTPQAGADWAERHFAIGSDGMDADGNQRYEIVKKLVIDCE